MMPSVVADGVETLGEPRPGSSREAGGPAVAAVPISRGAAKYRADIDGLRALAVGAVIATHAKIPGCSGGFVGVDIFFVISGYLIYGDLVARLRGGRLSFLDFYGRRVRRTLPCLYVVGLATLVAGAFVLMPSDLDDLARSFAAAICLVPNIFFFTQSGYFDAAAGTQPLLHTWSLGVEEQFYLLAPLLPLALRRAAPGRRRLALLSLFVASLVGCTALRHLSPSGAFYLMPARVFEFLAGAAVVERMGPRLRRPWHAEVLAAAALGVIVWAIGRFSGATPHPGLITLAPCLATAAIIHIGTTRQTVVARVLAWRPFAFLGLISYSLYLWHWPLLVLSHLADLAGTPALLVTQAVLLLALSVLTWRFIEKPFRAPGSVWRRRAPVILPAAAASLLLGTFVVVALHGVPQRFPPELASIASYYAYRDHKPFREGQCFITSKNWSSDYDRATCLKIVPGAENVLLLGDSHAAHLWTALRDTWPALNVLQATASGCKPVIGTTGAARCTRMMREMITDFVPRHRLDVLVLGAYWEAGDIAPLKATIAALTPFVRRIVVFGPVPRYDTPLATLVAADMLHGRLDDVATHLYPDAKSLDARMRAEIAPLATYVSPYEVLCPNDRCRILAAPGVPLQFDYHHLTPPGADLMMTAIRARAPFLFQLP